MVTDAVEKLSKNAEDMLQFIDKKVMKDYDSFVDVANQYRDTGGCHFPDSGRDPE